LRGLQCVERGAFVRSARLRRQMVIDAKSRFCNPSGDLE
jgi:hypothetical protein